MVNLFFQLLFNIRRVQLEDWHIDQAAGRLTLRVLSSQSVSQCPLCSHPSSRIHSRYQRTLADLPWAIFSVIVQLKVRKFFCLNGRCRRRIFTERVPDLVAPWARRTQRLAERLTRVGVALGGAAGARLSFLLGMGVCRNTLLTLVRRAPKPVSTHVKIVGVDDFAFRKRHRYGTVLIDLEKNQPLALLENREAGTLAHWLRAHPGIELITRDRSGAYADGARQGAPNATQVADRFHLLQNVAETLESVFAAHGQAIEAVNEANRQRPIKQPNGSEAVPIPLPRLAAKSQRRAEQRRTERLRRFNQVWELHRQGWRGERIAHHLGIGKSTVFRYLRSETFPERKRRSDRGRGLLDPYKAYFRQRWNEGYRDAKRLMQELIEQGYSGSYATVARYAQRLRRAQEQAPRRLAGGHPPPVAEPKQKPLTARRATWLVMRRPERREPEHEHHLAQLKAQQVELAEAIELTEAFAALVRHRRPEQLDAWLTQAATCSLAPFRHFAKRLWVDYDAVKAGVTVAWSNGPVEGHINRLKMIKRSMFGRAKLDLLSQRFLHTA